MHQLPQAVYFILPRASWPPYAGQSRHAYFLGKAYRKIGAKTILISISLQSSKASLENRDQLSIAFDEVICINISIIDLILIIINSSYLRLIKGIPLQASWLASPLIRRRFESIIKQKYQEISSAFVHVFSVRSYSLWRSLDALHIHHFIDLIDSMTLNTESRITRSQFIFNLFWQYELRSIRRFESSLPSSEYRAGYNCVSELDATYLQISSSSNQACKIATTSIGVEVPQADLYVKQGNNPIILFFGSLSYWPNLEAIVFFVNSVLPLLTNIYGDDLRFWVAGRNPGTELTSILQSTKNTRLIANPIDMRRVISSSSLTVAPIISGSGQQNKILDSLALNIPVVASRKAVNALKLIEGKHLLAADTPSEYFHACRTLLDNPELAKNIAAEGLEYIKSQHDWNTVGRTLINTFFVR